MLAEVTLRPIMPFVQPPAQEDPWRAAIVHLSFTRASRSSAVRARDQRVVDRGQQAPAWPIIPIMTFAPGHRGTSRIYWRYQQDRDRETTMADVEVGDGVELVTELLLARMAAAVPATIVREEVRQQFAAFDDAPIRDFVAVFVGRRVRAQHTLPGAELPGRSFGT